MDISNSILRGCKDSQGGVQELYLFKYIKYSRSQISVVDNSLILFPETTLYKFETIGDFDVTQTGNEEEGGKFFDTSLSFKLKTHPNIGKFLNFDFRAVIKDRNGWYRLLGIYNGLTCDSVNKTTGNSKADFNGFTLSFTGQEILEAPYFQNIEIVQAPFLLQEDGFYLLQENSDKILI